METFVRIDTLRNHVGETVTVRGWLYNKRSSKKLVFLEVRDGSGIVQAIAARADVGDEVFAVADHMAQETSLSVTGEVRAHPKQDGVFELAVKALVVIGAVVGEYPISPKDHGTDFLMDHRHLWLRSR